MLRTLIMKRVLLLSLFCLALISAAIFALPRSNSAADFSGREILSVTRIAHGGADYANLQYVTVKANGKGQACYSAFLPGLKRHPAQYAASTVPITNG